jgi:hypothetical protein
MYAYIEGANAWRRGIIHIHTDLYTYIYVYIHTHMHMHTCIYMYIFVYVEGTSVVMLSASGPREGSM